MSVKAQVARLAMEKAILDYLEELHEEAREEFRPELDPGDRLNHELGYALMTKPAASYKVVDHAAFFQWVAANVPDAIVVTETVNASFKDRITKAGGYMLDGDLIPVDGVEKVQGTPQLRVVPSDRAKASAPILLAGILEELPEGGWPEVEQ